mgnify:CR=1 FL=1
MWLIIIASTIVLLCIYSWFMKPNEPELTFWESYHTDAGRETKLVSTNYYSAKIIDLKDRQVISFRFHKRKHKSLIVLSGNVIINTLPNFEYFCKIGSTLEISPNTIHKITSLGDSQILEISTPQPWDLDLWAESQIIK